MKMYLPLKNNAFLNQPCHLVCFFRLCMQTKIYNIFRNICLIYRYMYIYYKVLGLIGFPIITFTAGNIDSNVIHKIRRLLCICFCSCYMKSHLTYPSQPKYKWMMNARCQTQITATGCGYGVRENERQNKCIDWMHVINISLVNNRCRRYPFQRNRMPTWR